MSYIHKSGAQKRKERNAKEMKTAKSRSTLQSFGITISSSTSKEQIGNITIEEDYSNTNNKSSCASNIFESEINKAAEPESMQPISEDARIGKSDANELCAVSCLTDITYLSHEKEQTCKNLLYFDIGIPKSNFTTNEIEEAVRLGPEPYPTVFPPDDGGNKFPTYVLRCHLKNNEEVPRDWLVWSKTYQALFCFPCRLFSKLPLLHRSIFTTTIGWGPSKNYKKLYNKIPDHENSNNHRACFIEWRNFQNDLKKNTTLDRYLLNKIQNETQVWKDLLQRLLDVVLFLSERGLGFRGNSNLIGDSRNGNFLGILEVISHYDPLLNEHLKKVKESQIEKKRLQVHYLSPEIQNEFISCCAENVLARILKEREVAKYFSIIVDATPDSAHIEQTTFILRYVLANNETNEYEIFERFIEFVDCNKKTGEDIANLILQTLEKRNIPISDCRAQGYDNGPNMSGAYKGVQARILEINPLAIFSPCACHSLNLCGVHSAECCPEVIKFFGFVQKLYNIFSSSPQRWEILKQNTKCSLHSTSNTRWSARIESVKPIVENLPSIIKSIYMVLELNLTAETRTDLNVILTYMESFECILMAKIWFKILSAINYRSTILQAHNTTIDIEVANLSSLLTALKEIRNNWEEIVKECQLVAVNSGMQTEFSDGQKRKRQKCSEESKRTPNELFHFNIFNVVLDNVIANITSRFTAAEKINDIFSVLWLFRDLSDFEIQKTAKKLQNIYKDDINDMLSEELIHLKTIYDANIKVSNILPIVLLSVLKQLNFEAIFPNVVIGLRIFCTIPVTVAQAERSFSCLGRIKNVLRSTMCQSRLSSLGLLSIEATMAKNCDFSEIIDRFASRKARKAPL